MKMRLLFLIAVLGLFLNSCNEPLKVDIINNSKQVVKITFYKKGVFLTSMPYDSSFLEKDYECRMTRLEPGKSLNLLMGLKADSTVAIDKLGFEKIQIETPQGHITATRSMIPTLFCKHGSQYILMVK